VLYTSTEVPVAIPDDAPLSPATSTLTVANDGLLADIAVEVSVTHPFVNDLALDLQSPHGRTNLSFHNGGSGENYTRTVFADSGATSTVTASAPFTGVYRPEDPFRWIYGSPLRGNYQLRVGDGFADDTGSITSFAVATCECRGACEFGPAACQNGLDDDGDTFVDCDDSACAAEEVCTNRTEYACSDGVDNDGNGQTDCDDPACSWACTTLGPGCTGSDRLFVYGARDLPLAIPTATGAQLVTPVTASASGLLVGAAVRFDVTHTFVSDLTLVLTSPRGTVLVLADNNGGGGEDYTNTILVDSGPGTIGTVGYI
jgi:subtilisin-like proprotein convertase family protein